MFVYSIKNKKTGKEFIGGFIGATNKGREGLNLGVLLKHYKQKLNKELHEDLQKEGMTAFSATILYQTDNLKTLEDMEEFYILKRNTIEKGYNTNTGYRLL